MRDLNLHALSDHVAAWHNRHPLARRITAAQVHSVGYVALPFLADAHAPGGIQDPIQPAAPGTGQDITQKPPAAAADASSGATLPERAMAREQGTEAARASAAAPVDAVAPAAGPPSTPTSVALAPAFSEDFIAPLTPLRVARWAAVHGVALAMPPADAPVRQVTPDGTADVTRLQLLWVLTAQLEVGRSRSRVLIGAGDAPSVLGHRLWSRTRIAALAALSTALFAGAVALRNAGPVAPAASSVVTGASAAFAASAPSAPSAGSAASTPAAAAPASSPSASATASAAVASVADPTRPLDVEPTLGRVTLTPIGPSADERRKAARLAAEQERRVQATLPPSTPAAAAAAAAPTAAKSPRAAAAGPAFAVSTRLLRTRTESEQVAAAMRALLVTAGTPQMHVEVMPAGEDWRVVGWPYANRAQAEKSRALLARRGMRVEVIDF